MKYSFLFALLLIISCKGVTDQTVTYNSNKDSNKQLSFIDVKNPSFEDNLDDSWAVNEYSGGKGSGKQVTGIGRTGNKSVKLSKTNAYGYLQLTSRERVTVEPGETYTFRFWFNSSNAEITSFLIPRLVSDNEAMNIANTKSALWVDYDYDSQSLMRNAQSTKSEDWIKRVIFYTNHTDKPEQVFLQMMMYGNPFDVYIDDVSFFKGIKQGINTPDNPKFNYTEKQVKAIIKERKVEESYFTWKDNTQHFMLSGEEKWPRLYRASPGKKTKSGIGQQDPQGMHNAGVEINNVMVMSDYWIGKDKYDFKGLEKNLMMILRKNPYAKIHLDFSMDPYREWLDENPDSNWEIKDGKKMNEASYASRKWREDGAVALRELINDMKKHGYWKIVAGCVVWGGHDGQFWTKVIGEFASDYSPEHVANWHNYLAKEYLTIGKLNKVWNSNHTSFNKIAIPDIPKLHEDFPAISPKGQLSDYRQYVEAAAFDLREHFAEVIKKEAGKKFYVMSYGMPMENQHERFLKIADNNGKANDVITSMSYYPYRQPGLASGYHPEQSFGYHNTAFCQELDLRSYASDAGWYNELADMWCSSQPTIEDWRNMHRKLVGISLAQDQAYWYYDMDKQFVDDAILDEISEVSNIADKLVSHKGVNFKPDVCLVRFGAESRYYGTSVDNAVAATNYWQYMLLETAGVPFDIHYLMDIMTEPSLQDYKVYVFHNNTYLSEIEKEWITKNLKKDGKIIVWMYDTGYATDNGLSKDDMSDLIGMNVGTENRYQRAPITVGGTDQLTGGHKDYIKVPEFQGMAEALCSIFSKEGSSSIGTPYICRFGYMVLPGVSRYQKFWIEDGFDSVLAKYNEDGKAAIAVKRFSDWTSIYVGAPNAMASEMFNNIAKEARAYRCGPAAMGELRMSGRFVSYHALKTGKYEFKLPKGASRIIDAVTGRTIARNVSSFIINGEAQSTYWYFIE